MAKRSGVGYLAMHAGWKTKRPPKTVKQYMHAGHDKASAELMVADDKRRKDAKADRATEAVLSKRGRKQISTQTATRFLVVSHDNDEGQWFNDYVVAANEASAEAFILEVRPYANCADAFSVEQLRRLASVLQTLSSANINEGMRELGQQYAESEDDYTPTNYFDSKTGVVIKTL